MRHRPLPVDHISAAPATAAPAGSGQQPAGLLHTGTHQTLGIGIHRQQPHRLRGRNRSQRAQYAAAGAAQRQNRDLFGLFQKFAHLSHPDRLFQIGQIAAETAEEAVGRVDQAADRPPAAAA